jgi:transposase-like protein
MPLCPSCQQPASKRNGFDRRGRQKYTCSACRRTFTEDTASAFSGYRWPADVILTAVRWYLSYPLSSRQVLELLAERGMRTSNRRINAGGTSLIERDSSPILVVSPSRSGCALSYASSA